jgi:DNA-binding MarR family transcriptional regulator
VSQTVKKLEEKGYLEKTTVEEDCRLVRIKLTARGV